MGKRKTRKRSRRGGGLKFEKYEEGKPMYTPGMWGIYIGHEICAWYSTIDSCSNGACSKEKVTAKNQERCKSATVTEEADKFDPVAVKGTFTKAPSQDESFKTKRLPGNIQNLKNAQELLKGLLVDQNAGSKNVYYIYHEETSGSTKGPRWALRVLYNCNVSLVNEKKFTFKSPHHNDPVEVVVKDGKLNLSWGKNTRDKIMKLGTLIFGDFEEQVGGRKRRKKRRRRTKKKSRKKRKRTKKRRRRRR